MTQSVAASTHRAAGPPPRSDAPVLQVEHLGVRMATGHGVVPAVCDVSFSVRPGEVLAVVGESGAGKSVTLAALMGLLPAHAQVRGSARLEVDGRASLELLGLEPRAHARLRGRSIALLPQSPTAHLTPVRTVGAQLTEAARLHHGGRAGIRDAVRGALRRAGVSEQFLGRYPHELSGGQAQRVSNAAALLGRPSLVLADEPTTGLEPELVDATCDELRRLAAEESCAVVLVTHDLSAARRCADSVAVMYAGRVVERRDAASFFEAPAHPYSVGLLRALPEHGLHALAGHPPDPARPTAGCAFAPRCAVAVPECSETVPGLAAADLGAACRRPGAITLEGPSC